MSGTSASIAAAYAAALSITTPSLGKTPGEVHCYNGICHRVKSVDEMRLMVGSESDAVTSFYDVPDRDRMNAGTITSSGEEFDADSDSHAASSLYPDGTELLIWNPKNHKTAHIRVNDFGPFYMLRTIDVTRGVAEKLEFSKTGVASLKIIVVWAPSQDEARFRRRRVYPSVEGYIGRFDIDQLTALKSRLIETAVTRNASPTRLAAREAPLPAFAGAGTVSAQARRKAAIANTPRVTLQLRTPVLATVPTRAPSYTLAAVQTVSRAVPLGSAQAIAAASRPAGAIVAARDEVISTVVAGLSQEEDTTMRALASREAGGPAVEPAPRHASTDASVHRPWSPNGLIWQQLLVALGIMSAGGVAWRSRPAGRGRRIRTANGRVLSGGPADLAGAFAMPAASQIPAASASNAPLAGAGQGPTARAAVSPLPAAAEFQAVPGAIDSPLVLPQLPQRPAGKSMDDLRDEAVAHMEAYAYTEAEAAYRQLLAARVTAYGPNDPLTASAERQLADCLREQGRYWAAEPHYRRALATMALAAGELHPATADILDNYAVMLLRQGHGGRAEIVARQSLSVRRAASSRGREYAVAASIVAEALRAQGQLSHAEIEHRSAWAIFIAVSGQDSIDSAAGMMSLGTVLGELCRFSAAEELLNAGTRILTGAYGTDHPAVATGYALLGDLYRRARALEPAATMHRHALDIRQRVLGDRHPDTIESVLSLAIVATEQYRTDEARALLDRGLDGVIAGERAHFGPQSRIRVLLVALAQHHDTSLPARLAAE